MAHLAHDPAIRADRRTTLELGAVLPQTAEVRHGHLYVGGVDMVELAREQGTALYVMDVAQIRQQLRAYREALGAANQVVYAGKAFLNKAMVKLLIAEGSWLDVSSGGELAIALAAGFDPGHIVMHGNNKTEAELTEAIQAGVGLIVADCFEELDRISRITTERGSTQSILLRVKPGVVADTHAFIRTGAEDSKFGFGLSGGEGGSGGAARMAVENALALPGIHLAGLHAHIGSQIFALASFAETIAVLADFMGALRTSSGFTPEILDLGGGLGIAYQAADEPATIRDLGSLLTTHLASCCGELGLPLPRLMVEPGRSVVATAGLTLYTVGVIKKLKGLRCYVAIDGGMTDNIRTALYDARYEATLANRAAAPRDTVVTLAGKHCESGDVVALDASLQSPEIGDIVAVFGTGAYNASMSSNYNAQVRPGVVFVEDGEARLVQRRETYADLTARDVE
ncbi:MAG: diaminopimelate decarboxylase [Coriobacteriales bacterium]|jgi:diaminopimelate decarboxylase|nr:diaminopimelate decarboxylase [Coriobacteriales bacterium]